MLAPSPPDGDDSVPPSTAEIERGVFDQRRHGVETACHEGQTWKGWGSLAKTGKESKHLGERRRRVMARLRGSICSVGAKDMGRE